MAKIISISMAKGGVGKSVTSVNLCAALSLSNKKVLLIDLDPQQGNVTLSLGHTPSAIKCTIANTISPFMDLGQAEGIEKTIINISDNFHLMPANPKLETVQNRLIAERSNAGMFADDNAVLSHCVIKHLMMAIQDNYDYIIIDCPPSV